jgi:hypothetical protein
LHGVNSALPVPFLRQLVVQVYFSTTTPLLFTLFSSPLLSVKNKNKNKNKYTLILYIMKELALGYAISLNLQAPNSLQLIYLLQW